MDKIEETPETFEVDELDDGALADVAGGQDTNNCTNTNCAGANCVANCGGTPVDVPIFD
jgi:hypothetical protein